MVYSVLSLISGHWPIRASPRPQLRSFEKLREERRAGELEGAAISECHSSFSVLSGTKQGCRQRRLITRIIVSFCFVCHLTDYTTCGHIV